MSFSSETKNELARVKDIDVNDKQAELSAIVRMSGTIQFAGLRKIHIYNNINLLYLRINFFLLDIIMSFLSP